VPELSADQGLRNIATLQTDGEIICITSAVRSSHTDVNLLAESYVALGRENPGDKILETNLDDGCTSENVNVFLQTAVLELLTRGTTRSTPVNSPVVESTPKILSWLLKYSALEKYCHLTDSFFPVKLFSIKRLRLL
jgi:hypothetical protein